jgi:hypothetical protein
MVSQQNLTRLPQKQAIVELALLNFNNLLSSSIEQKPLYYQLFAILLTSDFNI